MATTHERTLDPADWDELRDLAHQMVDDMLTYLETVRERPVWQPMPDEARERFNQPLPEQPEGAEAAYQEFVEDVLPYPLGNIHPRFWGWVIGTGTPVGVLAEMLAATMNPNLGGADHAANQVERQVIGWCKALVGFPEEASGLLVSGGSMANLVGLTVARNTMAGYDIRREGVGAAPRPMTFYASTEVHSSNVKAVELLGLGQDALRLIPANDAYQIDLGALQEAIAQDRAAGCQPIGVIGCAGTVNTGAIDDLNALADLCEREGLWFHVDGAFGALAAISPGLRPLVTGMERADSLAFDLHKWMYMPFEVGCTLVRTEEAHRKAFSLTPDYLVHAARGTAAGSPWFSDYGVQLSRGFRALKVWMSLKAHGAAAYREMIQQNVDQTRYLSGLVDKHPNLERLAPTSLNIVCYRYVEPGLSKEQLDDLNAELLIQLQEQGIAVPSGTVLKGCYAIRVANTNQRSRREDFDLLVHESARLGKQLAQAAQAAS